MNHPSDTPDTCCPTCFGEGEILAESVVQEKADAQALADVRTLDDWARADGPWREHTMQFDPQHNLCHLTFLRQGEYTKGRVFDGPTPDAARHAAAEWVRGQK